MSGAIAIVVKGYPRLSETFIAQEIRALEERGLDLRIISLRRPTDRQVHPVHGEIRAAVDYLPEYLYREPVRVVRALLGALRRPRLARAARIWWGDFLRDPTPNRVRRFGQAMVLARELAPDVVQLHAHFLHTPASVARYASLLTGVPWSCSAHAKDIWTSPDWELREKLSESLWTVTCTRANCERLRELMTAGAPGDVQLLYHGLDGRRIRGALAVRPARDGSDSDAPVELLSVGRAVEKKGYAVLLAALARLRPGLHWRFTHVGDGPLLGRLRKRARELGIAQRVSWRGARAHADVMAHYASADLFVLACQVARDGDRDGLPNVLLEAQSQALACVSTRVSGVPELIEHEVNGLLVAEGDSRALAAALERLITRPELRARMGAIGRDRVYQQFSFDAGVDRLAAKFRRPHAAASA